MLTRSLAFALLAAVPLLCAAQTTGQQVLVVDPTNPGAFSALQPAIDAAQPGDTVLVRAGTYGEATVSKALALLADGEQVSFDKLSITATPLGSAVLVRGFHSQVASPSAVERTVEIIGCQGDVWLQDCHLDWTQNYRPVTGLMVVRDSRAVTLTNLQVRSTAFWAGVPALQVEDSAVHVFDSSLHAGLSTDGHDAAGILAINSAVYLQNTTARGGDGGPNGRGCGYDGGPGVWAQSNSTVRTVGATLVGGTGFHFGVGCASNSVRDGEPARVEPGSALTNLGSDELTFTAPSAAREAQPVDYVIEGQPGDVVALAFALQPDAFFFSLIRAPLLVGTQFVGIPVGTVAATGTLTLPSTAPTLASGVDFERYYVQVLALRNQSSILGGTGRAVTVLDSSF